MLGKLRKMNPLHLFLLGVLIILAVASIFQVVEAQPAFCDSCHEMDYQYSTWLNSTHKQSANCLDCHIEPGIEGFIQQKIQALKELIVHITGNYKMPINTGIRVKNDICLKCHSNIIPDKAVQIDHTLHEEKGTLCTDCHAKVVHSDPGEPNVMPLSQCDFCHQKHQSFPMTDSHSTLNCDNCHIGGIGTEQLSANCENCHIAPTAHLNRVYTNCEACHTLIGWKPATSDHSVYPLENGHYGRPCSNCHKSTDYTAAPTQCEECHTTPNTHFDTIQTCANCHTTVGWKPAEFNHSFYPLTDNHQTLTCTQCHPEGQFNETQTSCESCHTASVNHIYGLATACEACHVVKGWVPARYDHLALQLDGGHTGLACEKCHLNDTYLGVSKQCVTCHKLPETHFNSTVGCETCHKVSAWKPAQFNHTSFDLTGAHESLSCDDCHIGGSYIGLPTSCGSCHSTPATHTGLSTNCLSCHSTTRFSPSTFKHPREGEHIPSGEERLSCSSCHKSTYAVSTCTGSNCHSSTR